MRTRFTLMGHAVHPMLVTLPLGAIPTALVFDALHVWTRSHQWYEAALVATAVGAAGAVLAAAAGLVDYLTSVPRRGEVWRHASTHMLLGLAITGYLIANAAVRWFTLSWGTDRVAETALALNALGVVGLVVQGYLGGGLVEVHALGVHGVSTAIDPEERTGARPRRREGEGGGGAGRPR